MLAVTSIYRLIKFGGARRVLFLVDRSNLGNQAEKEFEGYRTPITAGFQVRENHVRPRPH
jgi:type I site-specific restriction endonuclease